MTTTELNKKISDLKAAQAAAIAELMTQKAAVEAQLKALEIEAKKAKEEATGEIEREKMRKFAELVESGKIVVKENKTEVILDCMIKGYCNAAIIAYTNYTVKEVTDITWRIYESWGCNPDR